MKTTIKKSSDATTTVKTAKKSVKKVKISDEAIRQRAYEIHLETGSPDEHANWLQAEKELSEKK